MKKLFVYIMIAAMCLSMCACTKSCGKEKDGAQAEAVVLTPLPTITPAVRETAPPIEGGFVPDMSTAPGASGQAIPAPAATAAPTPAPEPTPVPTPIPTPMPAAATPAPTAAAGRVVPVKSPTSELVIQGGSAQFVARANNSTGVTWFVASPDAKFCMTAVEAPHHFYGLRVSGYNSDTLTLSNIPLSMSGWKVQARYDGFGGPVHTNMAEIWVMTMQEAINSGYYNPGYYNPGYYNPGAVITSPGYSWSP